LDDAIIAVPEDETVLDPPPSRLAVGHCTRSVRPLHARDPVSKAAHVLRMSAIPVLPVVEGERVAGVVDQATLSLRNGAIARTMVGSVMAPPPPPLSAAMPADEGLQVMEELDLPVAPVVDGRGRLAGMVSRADLVSLASGQARPSRCGGMATPLGVYLTTGVVRSGAGDFGLVLSGFLMGLLALVSLGVAVAAVWAVDEHFDLGLLAAFGWLPDPSVRARRLRYAVTIAWVILYTLLFRLSPLAGYHGAEHMTVNAIEHGEELSADTVSRHSRVHPRCGTNLVVVLVLFSVLAGVQISGIWLGLIALVVVANRTVIGGVAQWHVTTRPPTPWELESGVEAGRRLLEAHQGVIGRPVSLLRRIWCMGLLQSIVGLALSGLVVRGILWAAGLDYLLRVLL
jgi:CBS domain-containing protein